MLRTHYDADAMRRRLTAAVAVVAALSLLGAAPGASTSVDQLKRQRQEVQRQRAQQASQINVLKANERQLEKALDALATNRKAQEAALASARVKAQAAAARAAAAQAAEQRTARRMDALRGSVRDLAVSEFMHGGRPSIDVAPDPSSPMETARRKTLLDAAVGHTSDVVDELRSARQDLQAEREAAEQAVAAAQAEQAQVEQQLSQLKEATKKQQSIADQIEARLERQLAEAESLARIDVGLANQIRSRQAALARGLRSSPSSGGGSRRVGNVQLSTVRGITVASSIANNLARLLEAASAAGIDYGGEGYRDPQQQVALRRAHCGSTEYDIYEKPASQCHPPTARPGQSLHEQGLAVDFTQDGSIIGSRSSGYRWLKANANRYGFYNLPSEPWHWSVNGD
jgi:LAS superfamily LD-carboxypeptidase LdcB